MSLITHQLSYHHDSAALFERIANQAWAIMLDSGQMVNSATGKAGSQYGRYDIIAAEPFITVVTTGKLTEIKMLQSLILKMTHFTYLKVC